MRNNFFRVIIIVLFFSCDGEVKKEYYPNGQLKIEAHIVDGKPHGMLKNYYEDGTLRFNGNYQDGKSQGEFVEYFPNGTIKRKLWYLNDTLHGLVEIYYKNGRLSKKFENVNGKIEGNFYEYDTVGVLRGVSNYVHGKRVIFREYGSDENLQLEEEYDGNLRHGNYVTYYQNGKTKQKGNYQNGKRNGWFMNYFSNGQMKDSVLMDMGTWVERYEYDSLGNYITHEKIQL